MLHVFGPKKAKCNAGFRALRPRNHHRCRDPRPQGLVKEDFPATESSVQKIVDKLIEFTVQNGYNVSANTQHTVAQSLVGSAARAIFVQYDVDRGEVRRTSLRQ